MYLWTLLINLTRCKDNTQMRINKIISQLFYAKEQIIKQMDINKRFEIIINSVYNGNQSAFAKAI